MTDNGTSPEQVHPQSFFEALKAAFVALASAARTRLNLFVVELEEERERLKQTLLLGLLAVVGFNLGFILLNIFLVVLFLDKGWLVALGFLTLFYLASGGIAVLLLRKNFLARRGLFSATLAELEKDCDRLRSPSHE
ncbi:MAG TPA: phage holin family protein [Methylomirabilota bacterium]|nr:phage holin family protein [Methylomirabilota bacterium]